jgi:hypothetical protein
MAYRNKPIDTIGWKAAEKPSAYKAAWETRTWRPSPDTGVKPLGEITTEIRSGNQISLIRMESISAGTTPAELMRQGMPEYPLPPTLVQSRMKLAFEEETEYQWWGLGGILKAPKVTRAQAVSFTPEISQQVANKVMTMELQKTRGAYQEVSQRQKESLFVSQTQRTGLSLMTELIPRSMQQIKQESILTQVTGQAVRTNQQQRTEQRQRFEQITDILPKTPKLTTGRGIAGWFDWGGGSMGGVFRRRAKAPFREVIPIKSQLFGGSSILKGISKKKKYVEVGKEYKTVVAGKKTRVKHISKTGR